jgi:hypothetical protein
MTSNCNHFFLVSYGSQYLLLDANECMMPCNMSAPYVPHQKKSSPNIDGLRMVGGEVKLIPVVSSSGMTYADVVSVPIEKHNRYITHIITYPLSGTHVFNAAWAALHTLQERIHIVRK